MEESTLGTTILQLKKEQDDAAEVEAFLTISERQQPRDVLQLVVWIFRGDALSRWQGVAKLADWTFLQGSGTSNDEDSGTTAKNDNDIDKQMGVSLLLSPTNEHEKLETHWTLSVDDTEIKVAIRDSRKGIKLTPWKVTLKKQPPDEGATTTTTKACFQALQSLHAELAATQQALATQKAQSAAEQA
eukprot:scaffold46507_cov214-Amphora_coffeaeformis.AAC.1